MRRKVGLAVVGAWTTAAVGVGVWFLLESWAIYRETGQAVVVGRGVLIIGLGIYLAWAIGSAILSRVVGGRGLTPEEYGRKLDQGIAKREARRQAKREALLRANGIDPKMTVR